jgi:Zn finger protein HypA/HybF involved in hydrogenase expression
MLGGRVYNEGMIKRTELEVVHVRVKLICPWCSHSFVICLRDSSYQCPGCQAEFTAAQILAAITSTVTPAEA